MYEKQTKVKKIKVMYNVSCEIFSQVQRSEIVTRQRQGTQETTRSSSEQEEYPDPPSTSSHS